jgi:hypothetical protein
MKSEKTEVSENVNLCSELTRLVARDVLSPLGVAEGWIFIKCETIIIAEIL